MMDDAPDRLERLRTGARRSLESVSFRAISVRRSLSGSAPSGRESRQGEPDVGPGPAGGAPALRDERRTRELAKEIKRLIAEDGRRGIRG